MSHQRARTTRAGASTWLAVALCATVAAGFAAEPPQPAAGADDAYLRTCAACHGPELRGGEAGPALIGDAFQKKWANVPGAVLELYTKGSMPPTNPGGLSNADYAAAV